MLQCIQFECWITAARIQAQPEYVTLTAFPLQKCLCEMCNNVRDMYIVVL